MEKRKYTHIQGWEAEIVAMQKAGKTHREIAEHFGLEKAQIKEFLKRYRRKQAKLRAGIMPQPKGRPRKDVPARDIVTEQACEIKRLKMENALLRDFLRFTERK